MMRVRCPLAALMVIVTFAWGRAPADEIDFQRDIRPILSDACFQCHGPDEEQREADLRLDTREGLFATLGDQALIVAGNAAESVLYQRLTHEDPDQRMPPVDEARQLVDDEIQRIQQWIDAGASWNRLWSFVPPTRPALPAAVANAWVRDPLDAFVWDRLQHGTLSPAAEASRETLLRRASFDLTGLPPQVAFLDSYLSDDSPVAYERAIDRLLASPRYGERMAVEWLNAARFSDTSGYQMDGPRQMWRWRDWVIDAFNAGMPFDQFTIEQCAGDLLPNPTLEQRIATAFHRNHRGNAEGGIIPEEYRVEYVVDRVETTSTVWLGLTLGCARCHDHKYDPLTQQDFYQFFAFFNNVPERGKARKWGNAVPNIKAPTPAEGRELEQLDQQIQTVESELHALEPMIQENLSVWTDQVRTGLAERTDRPASPLYDKGIVDEPEVRVLLDDLHQIIGPEGPDEMSHWEGTPELIAGRLGQAVMFDGSTYVEVGDVAAYDYEDPFSVVAWIYPDASAGGAIVSRMESDTNERKGFSVELHDGHIHVNVVRRWLDDCLRVRSVRKVTPEQWQHVVSTYDGSKLFGGIVLYLDGEPLELEVIVNDLQQPFMADEPFRIGSRGTQERFHGRIDDVRLFDRVLQSKEVRTLSVAESTDELLVAPHSELSDRQQWKLRQYYLKFHASPVIGFAFDHLANLQALRKQLFDKVSTVMVMEEMDTPRDTYVLVRGQYDQPGKQVFANVPASLPQFPEDGLRNRLGLAHWLLDDANPLTARVAVNRTWQLIFGQGLVGTPEDFGSQGEKPSHPALLDWLAIELRRTQWDVKSLYRSIVTSATYRQSSVVTPEKLQLDRDNRLLSRGSRYRLPAEMIRDLALASSGLLVEHVGGPSVKPYQPPGLWVELTLEASRYVPDFGPSLYRRSLYTYWKRTVAPPGMLVMDAPQREMCSVRMSRTNTPLQALNLMNDVAFVEAARALAQRVLVAGGATDESRLIYAFRLLTSRYPQQQELQILLEAVRHHRDFYEGDSQGLSEQLIHFGDSSPDTSLNSTDLAAYTIVMNLLLNLDEVITRE
ncbi:MAG: DUF1553 domain-containing protein [Pirellulaceae bacterium]|nr:DUF1553 domain-containing protein [Pirellulaceae bacterium]